MLSRRTLLSTAVLAMSLLAGGAALLPPTAQAAAQGGPAAYAPTAEDKAFLKTAETYMSGLKTLQARILQITSSGSSLEGMVAIKRPGKMNLSYDPPSQVKIIADGTWLIYVDKDSGQVTHLPLDSTPAGILLRDNVRFSDPDIILTGVRRAKGVNEVDVVMASDPAAGKLTLVFADAPFELRQWRVTDAQGIETMVSLFDAKTAVTFKNELFVYTDLPGDNR
ncbi:LolA family protein [Novispirillum itersonii]|uniref:Outer membrane lipoprotein-sorting protein n=1 Tax=Novispirillum itersonii TaxID=189 RepID=A0A7W9ZFV5_NOVIT|nr:outer membrane lipoprotein carrier protein LolA [Novispirillum itersonii]MBB6209862.1 outer membrane lipoprotein-sorting protein [Novispirillum itersonii]